MVILAATELLYSAFPAAEEGYEEVEPVQWHVWSVYMHLCTECSCEGDRLSASFSERSETLSWFCESGLIIHL